MVDYVVLSAPVCIYVVGEPPPAIREPYGDYNAWFRRLVEASGGSAEAVDGFAPTPPNPRDYAGIVITGSAASMTEPEPWMEAGVEMVREAVRLGTPVLGVCFGHQLIGACYGATVQENPRGWEISTCAIELTESGKKDPLFAGLPDKLLVNQSHRDEVTAGTVAPGNGGAILAGSDKAPVQAMAGGDSVRGIQFHPEFTGDITRAYVELRRDELGDADALAALAEDTPVSERVFANWMEQFVSR